ncbi:MAG: hypothetical protein ABSB83_04905 [Methanomassiliicoccales archaeon]|jgi:hypothetical protein
MVAREIGEALMELQRALIDQGMAESDAVELVDEFEMRIVEALGDSDTGSRDGDS